MKRVLVSGGLGFLGSHLVNSMLKRQDVGQIVVVDNLWTGSAGNEKYIRDPRVKISNADVETFRSDQLFDEVLHLASPASPVWYANDPTRTISANIIGAFRLKELLKPNGRFCYTSTSEVYGDPLVTPQPESYRGSVDCTGPRSSYDESKRCTEAFLFENNRVHGLDVRVARLFNVYGPRTRPDDGRAVSNFISQALSGEPLTIYGDGEQSRSWGYVDDIIEGLSRLFWKSDFDYVGPVNIGNGREISVIDVARYIADLVPGTQLVYCPPAPQDPTNRCPDLTVAERLLDGWRCRTDYETGIRHTLDWFAENHFPRIRRKLKSA
ncbi:NAD-dependent epimerase/dehydratase family protein [Rhizobium sp. TH2]|uniref:NAD-dependent epimerase/dehydratase family protein n=1 Tax=Rhizobium sp. TH2 TaxID=2775403 RepID=UPI0021588D14|nr:NAD-dependent epimerase/dehydratase family protein [Rhizobium sp. TH2]UVC11652.1 NAD-dependent epimerase/dehydratase family protein [Rhizobium sp. TH2]